MNPRRAHRLGGRALALAAASLVSLAVASAAQAASVTPVEPPGGATLYDPGAGKEITLRWKVGLDGCEPLNNTLTTFLLQSLDASGAVIGESSGLPDPPESGSGAGLFASAANLQRTLVAVGNLDGTPARHRWKATLYCTKIGQGTTILETDWQEFRVFRNANAAPPGGTATPPATTTPTPTPKAKSPKRRVAKRRAPTDVSRCEAGRGWGSAQPARNYRRSNTRPVAGDGPMSIRIAQRNPLTTRVVVNWGTGEGTTRHRSRRAKSSVGHSFRTPGWHRVTVTFEKINRRTGKPIAHCYKRVLKLDVYVEGGDWYTTCDGTSCVEWRRRKADWALTKQERQTLAVLKDYDKLISCRVSIPSDAAPGLSPPRLLGPLGLVSSVLGSYCQAVQYSGIRDPRYQEGATYSCASACPPGTYRREENVGGV